MTFSISVEVFIDLFGCFPHLIAYKFHIFINFENIEIKSISLKLDSVGFVLSLLQSEINAIQMSSESIEKSLLLVESTSADFTNTTFLTEPQSACLRSFEFLLNFALFLILNSIRFV